MNDTQTEPTTDDGFDPHRLRGFTDIRRSSDDRMIAGVSTGTARYLRIDPVVVRIIFIALAFVGGAGIFLYIAAWFLLPSDDADRSIIGRWFRLSAKNDENIRFFGFAVAALVSIVSAFGMMGNSWGEPFPWFGIAALGVLYFLVIRPYQQRQQARRDAGADVAYEASDVDTDVRQRKADEVRTLVRDKKQRKSGALTLITLSTVLIALGATWLYATSEGDVSGATYLAVALGVIGLGLLVGTFFGHGGPLIVLGILVSIALAVASTVPEVSAGERSYAPETASGVRSSYQLGAGELILDFSNLTDPASLSGRTIKVAVGLGSTQIIVPDGMPVDVNASANAGDLRIFEREANGVGVDLDYVDPDRTTPALTIDFDGGLGELRVTRP